MREIFNRVLFLLSVLLGALFPVTTKAFYSLNPKEIELYVASYQAVIQGVVQNLKSKETFSSYSDEVLEELSVIVAAKFNNKGGIEGSLVRKKDAFARYCFKHQLGDLMNNPNSFEELRDLVAKSINASPYVKLQDPTDHSYQRAYDFPLKYMLRPKDFKFFLQSLSSSQNSFTHLRLRTEIKPRSIYDFLFANDHSISPYTREIYLQALKEHYETPPFVPNLFRMYGPKGQIIWNQEKSNQDLVQYSFQTLQQRHPSIVLLRDFLNKLSSNTTNFTTPESSQICYNAINYPLGNRNKVAVISKINKDYKASNRRKKRWLENGEEANLSQEEKLEHLKSSIGFFFYFNK